MVSRVLMAMLARMEKTERMVPTERLVIPERMAVQVCLVVPARLDPRVLAVKTAAQDQLVQPEVPVHLLLDLKEIRARRESPAL